MSIVADTIDEHAQRVAEYYDEWTTHYTDVFGDTLQAHRPHRLEDLHEYLLGSIALRDGQRVLDAGCGVCGPARYFARQRAVHIDALTVSASQAEEARQRNADAGQDSINVHSGDFHQLERLFPEGSFDTVYFLESLSHSHDPARVLAGARHVLKRGGAVYIKDFFLRPCVDEETRERTARVVRRVDELFAVKTPSAPETFGQLWNLGFLPEFVRPPRFVVDNALWQSFDARHAFDLFEGQPSFDWSQWLEMRFYKP